MEYDARSRIGTGVPQHAGTPAVASGSTRRRGETTTDIPRRAGAPRGAARRREPAAPRQQEAMTKLEGSK
ncbi:hypothetical protein OHB49_36425 [Streptomyces sp. NBC_01717]|uniref:hypothetical protein n=1 Tax=Streptomyces sp. NBC_01717 TaxID=2975918 RepID=UPI002E326A0B|nr:hypothetical protein [Streptomyces sp. NBC_01717]